MAASVVDASVIAAIAFQEPRASEARALVEKAQLWAPTLLPYELTNTARKKARTYPEQAPAILEQLQGALTLDIHWADVDHPAVLRLSLDSGLTTYDASYLYLARSLGLPLVTFDERVQAALQDRS